LFNLFLTIYQTFSYSAARAQEKEKSFFLFNLIIIKPNMLLTQKKMMKKEKALFET